MGSYVTSSDTELLLQHMQTMEDWRHSGDENIYIKSILEEKASTLNEIGSKVYKRYHDWERLKESLFKLGRSLSELAQKSNDVSQSINLTQSEKEEVLKLLADHTTYYNQIESQVNTVTKYTDAPQKYEDVDKKTTELDKRVKQIYSDANKRAKEEIEKKAKEAQAELNKKAEPAEQNVNMADTPSNQDNKDKTSDLNMDVD